MCSMIMALVCAIGTVILSFGFAVLIIVYGNWKERRDDEKAIASLGRERRMHER